MTSNKEEVLAGDDIGGNLAVIDSNILTESNDLESEVAATVSKYRRFIQKFLLC